MKDKETGDDIAFFNAEASRLARAMKDMENVRNNLIKDINAIGEQVYVVIQRYDDGSGCPPCVFTTRDKAEAYIKSCVEKHKDWDYFDSNENYYTYTKEGKEYVTYNIYPVTLNVGESYFKCP